MSTPRTGPSTFDRQEPIPGYRTVDLLGRGGSGEVWKAIAPGGLSKAIKIVYGDGNSAETEMRALTRIKDARHPLLLSIERIEIIENNLVIVTELADSSLKQHFMAARAPDQAGLPAAELLGYLRDSAEALDFLYDRCSLQHLDVKPENILLISGRAKLGDFGLVKCLYERSASMIGGLTPTYAPPELFEGKPTRHSDQYSLAIVYVHMLTGALPFTASSTAEMAVQHLRGVPDLSGLSKPERAVIARALSKDPGRRFGSCLEMVSELTAASASLHALKQVRASAGGAEIFKRPTVTEIGAFGAEGANQGAISTYLPRDTSAASVHTSPELSSWSKVVPPVSSGNGPSEPPLIVIGVGGTGTDFITKYLQRLRDARRDATIRERIEFLAIDTDAKALSARFTEDDLDLVRVVPIPLKNAEAYRTSAMEFLRWLGRRWLYNIPRDLTTDGYRPLGRLALLTHAKRVREAISAAFGRTVERSAEQPISPKVLIVGSISGGTGGGVMLDLAYAVRAELKRRTMPDECVHGLLVHSTPRGNADRDKARANAYSTLCELDHFCRPGSHYPGEPLLNVPPFHGNNTTFARTHLVQLGEGLNSDEWDLATEQLVEFAFSATRHPGQDFLSPAVDAPQSSDFDLRTYEILSLGAGSQRIVSHTMQRACSDVVRLWCAGQEASLESESTPAWDETAKINTFHLCAEQSRGRMDAAVKPLLHDARLDFDGLLADAEEIATLTIESTRKDYLEHLVTTTLNTTRDLVDVANRVDTMTGLIDQVLQCDGQEPAPGKPEALYDQMVVRMLVRIRPRIEALLRTIREKVNAPEARIEGARAFAQSLRRLNQDQQDKLLSQAAEVRQSGLAIHVDARALTIPPPARPSLLSWGRKRDNSEETAIRDAMLSYAATRLNETLLRAIAKLMRVADAEIVTLVEELDRLARSLKLLADPPPYSSEQPSDDEIRGVGAAAVAKYRRMLLSGLESTRREIALQVSRDLDRKLLDGHNGLSAFLNPDQEVRKILSRPLLETSRRIVLRKVQEIGCQLLAPPSPTARRTDSVDVVSMLTDGLPEADSRESAMRRNILVVPDDVDTNHIQSQLQPVLANVEIVPAKTTNITLCRIRTDRPLAQIADQIIGSHAAYKDLAAKLHTRIDITWIPLSTATRSAAKQLEAANSLEEAPSRTETAYIPLG